MFGPFGIYDLSTLYGGKGDCYRAYLLVDHHFVVIIKESAVTYTIGVQDIAILCPAIVLMGSQLQYMGRCLGVVGTRGSRIPILMSISVINAMIAMLIMNVIV